MTLSAQLTSLSVVIPCYNEAANIERTIKEIHSTLSRCVLEFEILVVNDGSIDRSAEILSTLSKVYPMLKIVEHPINLGYGRTLTTGLKSAANQIVFYTDADVPINFDDIVGVLHHFEDVDMILGFRENRGDRLRRRVYSLVYNWLVRALFKVPFRDINFSFKGFRKDLISSIPLDARTVFIDGQILVEAYDRGWNWKEVPITYYPRTKGKSSFDAFTYALGTLKEVLIYWRKRCNAVRSTTDTR